MNAENFIQQVTAILRTHCVGTPTQVVEVREYPGSMGAEVTAQVGELLLRVTLEYGIDFIVDVKAEASQEWHHLPEVLLLATETTYEPNAASVGKSLEDVASACRRFSENLPRLTMLFDSEHLADTERRLASIRQQVVASLTPVAQETRRGPG